LSDEAVYELQGMVEEAFRRLGGAVTRIEKLGSEVADLRRISNLTEEADGDLPGPYVWHPRHTRVSGQSPRTSVQI